MLFAETDHKNSTPRSSSEESQSILRIRANNEWSTLDRVDSDIASFLWGIQYELTTLNIPLPEDPLSLDDEQMEELLTQIVNNPKLANLARVKTFLNQDKNRLKGSPYMEAKVNTEIVNTYGSVKAKVSISDPEIISYIESLGYSDVLGIADGASKAVFKAKNRRKQFVAVKITKLEDRHQAEEDIMKSVQQKMSRALFGGFLKVNRLIKDEENQFMIIEEELANKTLRDVILEKRIKNQDFSLNEIRKIIKDLVESLYHMHVQNQVAHRDIKPQNIFYMQHRYTFGDYGEAEKKRVNILNPNIHISMAELKGSPMYMEPRLLKLWMQLENNRENSCGPSASLTHTFSAGKSFFQYDPFKADVYSLGIVFLELCLHNLGYRIDQQMRNLLCSQRSEPIFKEHVASIDLRSKEERYVLFGRYLYEMPNLLEKMLEEDETMRIQTFNLALLATPKQTQLSHILTPFTDIFLPNKTMENGQYRVQYNYKGMIYKGEFQDERREGRGTIYQRVQNLSNIRQLPLEENEQQINKSGETQKLQDLVAIYQGDWKSDLPHGSGVLKLNDSNNRYEGDFVRGMFCGEGAIYYGDQIMYSCPWKANYNQYILKPLKTFPFGVFRFRMVCAGSKTVFGFVQPSLSDVIGKVFIVEMAIEQHSAIKNILDEVLSTNKKLAIISIRLRRNLLHGYTQVLLEKQNQNLVLVFVSDAGMENWALGRIMEVMNVEKTKFIDLRRSQISCPPFKVLSKSLRCFTITDLNLSHCYFISADTLTRFFMTSIVNSLTKLDLTSTQTNNDTMRVLAESKYLVRIRELVLRGCMGITDYAIKYFIQSPNVKQLQLLDIGHTNLAQGFTQGFLWQTSFKRLRTLRIDYLDILPEDMVHLSEQQIMKNLVEFHADPSWIEYLSEFTKLRSLTFKGNSKIRVDVLMNFLLQWKHNRLDVSAIKITHQQQSYDYFEQYLPALRTSNINSVLVGCCQIDIYYVFELIKGELQVLEVDMNKNIQIFKFQFQNIKARRWNIKQLVFFYNRHVLEYIISILQLDFGNIEIQSLKIVGYYNQDKTRVFQQLEENKIRFLEFCEMLKKISNVIKMKKLIINEIFYTDIQIAEMIRLKLISPVLETLEINATEFKVANEYLLNSVQTNACNINQTQSLDETFHALSASECLTQLRGLNLFKRQNVGEKGLAHIINSKYCENIKQLNLSYTDIGNNIFSLLSRSQHLTLNKLTLNGIKTFQFEDLKEYILSNKAQCLRKISLKDTNLNQLDIFFLQLTLQSLEEIDIKFQTSLEGSHLDDLVPMMKYQGLKKIYLDLSNCQIKKVVEKIFMILQSPALSKLKLNLRSCKQKDLKYCDLSSLVFLKYLKVRKYQQLRVYFDDTTIFETSFIVYLQRVHTEILDLSFSGMINDQFVQKLSYIASNITRQSIILNFEKSQLTDNCSRDMYDLIRRMSNIEQLNINFTRCKSIIHWEKILESFPSLKNVKKLHLNFSDCKIADEFQLVVDWIGDLTSNHKLQLSLNLSGCQRVKLDRVYSKLGKLLEQKSRFVSKIRLDVTRFKIPLDFKYKLIELNNSSERYQLLVDSSDI